METRGFRVLCRGGRQEVRRNAEIPNSGVITARFVRDTETRRTPSDSGFRIPPARTGFQRADDAASLAPQPPILGERDSDGAF